MKGTKLKLWRSVVFFICTLGIGVVIFTYRFFSDIFPWWVDAILLALVAIIYWAANRITKNKKQA
jgi:hypothetical protein